MPKATKLDSGSWRVRVYSHTENGVKKYVSFTGYTKAEVELQASEYAAKKKRLAHKDITIADAIEGYITAKEGVLSPATITNYRNHQKNRYNSINHLHLCKVTTADIQSYVSEISLKYEGSSIQPTVSLLLSAIRMYQPDVTYRITLPQRRVKRPVSPSEEDIKKLLANTTGKLHICIELGIRGFRRAEIAALKYEDITDNIAHIHAVFVKTPDKKWIYKECPKTEGSDRFVKVPDLGQGEGFVLGWTPTDITNHFNRARYKLDLKHVSLHDLRHFFASSAAVLNIPDIYTADMGGWSRAKNSPVLKTVYQNNIVSMSEYYQDLIDKHLTALDS